MKKRKIQIYREDFYNALVEDLEAIVVEGIYNTRWLLIETYHRFGKRILEENDNFERKKIYGKKLIAMIAKSLKSKIDARTIYYAIKFAKKYPCKTEELASVLMPEHGKNLTWTKVVRGELTTSKKECEHDFKTIQIQKCIKCGKIKK